MKRTNGSLAHRARPLFVMATLAVSIVLAFSPGVPMVTALSVSPDPSPTDTVTPSPDPGQSIAPDPTPVVVPDPTPLPAPDPTPEPTIATPDPAPVVTPDPAPVATPDPTPAPAAIATPEPTPAPADPATPVDPAAPAPAATPVPAPTIAPIAPQTPVGPHAVRFDAAWTGAAIAEPTDAFALSTFTIETWFTRQGPGIGPRADVGVATGEGGLGSATPLLARGSYDPTTPRGVLPSPKDRINWFLGIDTETAVLVADFQDSDGRNHPIVGATALADDVWYHAAATFDGAVWRLYLNGRLEAELVATGVAPDPSGAAQVSLATSLAADGTTSRGAFDGSMDEVRIWRDARIASDIREDMHSPIDPAAEGLVGAWTLDQDSGTTGADSIQPGIPLALRGRATWVDSPVPVASVPSAPRSLMAVAGARGISLAWTPVDAVDLAGYAVFRSGDPTVDPLGAPLSGRRPIASNEFLDETAVPGVTYSYAVTAVDRYGDESDPSPDASATLDIPTGASPFVAVRLDLSSTAPGSGRRRIDPGTSTSVSISVTPAGALTRGTLVLGVPAGWTVTDAGGARSAVGEPRLAWDVTSVPAGTLVTRTVALIAPLVSPVDGGADVESTFTAAFEQAGGASEGPTLTIVVAPLVAVEHRILGQVDDLSLLPTYLPDDAAITDEHRFEVFRVRFQVQNLDDVARDLAPLLEVRDSAAGLLGVFAPVAALDGVSGTPFYVAREWTSVGGRETGTELGPEGEPHRCVGVAHGHGNDWRPDPDHRLSLDGAEPRPDAGAPAPVVHGGRVQCPGDGGRPIPHRLRIPPLRRRNADRRCGHGDRGDGAGTGTPPVAGSEAGGSRGRRPDRLPPERAGHRDAPRDPDVRHPGRVADAEQQRPGHPERAGHGSGARALLRFHRRLRGLPWGALSRGGEPAQWGAGAEQPVLPMP